VGPRKPGPSDASAGIDCLLLDLDGTLLDLAERPDTVRVPENLPAVLEAVRDRLDGALALVSGRPIATLDRLLAPLRTAAAGVHGAELRTAPHGPILRRAPPAALEVARRLLARGSLPSGVLIEDKGTALAVHWRAAGGEPRALVERLLAMVRESGGALEAVAGKAVLELRGAGFDKGTAVAALLRLPPFSGRRPIVVGDDRTDLDAFRAAEAAGGVALAVGPTPPGGRRSAFAGPAAVRAWLERAASGRALLPVGEEER
jgi:trehalose 6-phosphate phosphatase